MQCETISLIKFQPSHGAVDFLGNLGAYCWENPNLDSCFYFKAVNLLFKQKMLPCVKFKKREKVVSRIASRSDAIIMCQKLKSPLIKIIIYFQCVGLAH